MGALGTGGEEGILLVFEVQNSLSLISITVPECDILPFS